MQIELPIGAELRPDTVNLLPAVQRSAIGQRGSGNVLVLVVTGVNVAGADDPAETPRAIRAREPEFLGKDGLIQRHRIRIRVRVSRRIHAIEGRVVFERARVAANVRRRAAKSATSRAAATFSDVSVKWSE